MSMIRRAIEMRDAIFPAALAIPAPGAGGRLASSGVAVTDRSALSVMTFFAGVRIIVDTVALTPLHGFTRDQHGLRVPIVSPPEQLTDPFMDFNLQEGLSQIVTSLILRGNAYLVSVAWDGSMNPTKWRILNPDQVSVSWDADGFRQYQINGKMWPTDRVWHIAGFMLPGDLRGAGIVEYCRNAIGLGIALDDVSGSFFKNGIMASGIVSTDVPLTQDEVRATAQQFANNHTGIANAGLPIVIGGGAKFTPISLTPEDAQFLQSRQFQQGEIATLLGIPPHLLGIVDKTTSWGTGIEVQGRAFVDYTLRSYYVRIESLFTSWLVDGASAAFDIDAITKADTATRYENYNKAVTTGFLNNDEVRYREGLPPIPSEAGRTYYTPTILMPAGSAPAAPTPADNPATASGDTNASD